jgi:hypothetical protein
MTTQTSQPQLDRIEARLRTLTILQQRMRLQIERIAEEVARLASRKGTEA